MKRENATLKVMVSEGTCQVSTSLENGVIEKFPGEFLELSTISSQETTFHGELLITVDSAMEKKELLIELLKREGILNFQIAEEGEFILSQEDVGHLLEEIDTKLQQGQVKLLENDVRTLRQIVIDKLAAHNLPLLRIWYHPRINGVVMQAVFSVRFDIDRAITNLAHIRALERKYDVTSTLYIRVFCPFYTDEAIKELASMPWCSELALHGEFVTHARRYGNEIKAAEKEKAHLESLTGRSILGVAMHGGELTYNRSNNTETAIERAGLLYDTTLGPTTYYFPFKKVVKGQANTSYIFPHALSDIVLLPFKPSRKIVNGKVHKSYNLVDIISSISLSSIRRYNQEFFEKTIEKMDEIHEQNGIFVMTLHPSYFGFFSYLSRPRNWIPLVKFLLSYFKGVSNL